jgi:hypothetical protein
MTLRQFRKITAHLPGNFSIGMTIVEYPTPLNEVTLQSGWVECADVDKDRWVIKLKGWKATESTILYDQKII